MAAMSPFAKRARQMNLPQTVYFPGSRLVYLCNAPDVRSQMDPALLSRLISTVSQFRTNDIVDLVGFSNNSEKYFAVGMDKNASSLERKDMVTKLYDFNDLLRNKLPQKSIAFYDGEAFDTGYSAFFGCNNHVASVNAKFKLSFLEEGTVPVGGLAWSLTRGQPARLPVAKFLACTAGLTFNLQDMYDLKLVDYMVAPRAYGQLFPTLGETEAPTVSILPDRETPSQNPGRDPKHRHNPTVTAKNTLYNHKPFLYQGKMMDVSLLDELLADFDLGSQTDNAFLAEINAEHTYWDRFHPMPSKERNALYDTLHHDRLFPMHDEVDGGRAVLGYGDGWAATGTGTQSEDQQTGNYPTHTFPSPDASHGHHESLLAWIQTVFHPLRLKTVANTIPALEKEWRAVQETAKREGLGKATSHLGDRAHHDARLSLHRAKTVLLRQCLENTRTAEQRDLLQTLCTLCEVSVTHISGGGGEQQELSEELMDRAAAAIDLDMSTTSTSNEEGEEEQAAEGGDKGEAVVAEEKAASSSKGSSRREKLREQRAKQRALRMMAAASSSSGGGRKDRQQQQQQTTIQQKMSPAMRVKLYEQRVLQKLCEMEVSLV